jgi:hypothetical protein
VSFLIFSSIRVDLVLTLFPLMRQGGTVLHACMRVDVDQRISLLLVARSAARLLLNIMYYIHVSCYSLLLLQQTLLSFGRT